MKKNICQCDKYITNQSIVATPEQVFRYQPCPDCGECDRFIKWIGKTELAKLNEGGLE